MENHLTILQNFRAFLKEFAVQCDYDFDPNCKQLQWIDGPPSNLSCKGLQFQYPNLGIGSWGGLLYYAIPKVFKPEYMSDPALLRETPEQLDVLYSRAPAPAGFTLREFNIKNWRRGYWCHAGELGGTLWVYRIN